MTSGAVGIQTHTLIVPDLRLLETDDLPAFPLQPAAAGFKRGAEQDWQRDGGVGAFRRLEEAGG